MVKQVKLKEKTALILLELIYILLRIVHNYVKCFHPLEVVGKVGKN